MSYQTIDESEQSGRPYLLFAFITGSTVWRYAAQPEAVTYAGQVYNSCVITADGLRMSGDFQQDTITVTAPATSDVGAAFANGVPDKITTLTISRSHFGNSGGVVIWSGRVISAVVNEGMVAFECEPVFSSVEQPGLRAVCLRTCTRVLYGDGCNLAEIDYQVAATLIGYNRTTRLLALTIAGSSPGFAGGTLQAPDGTRRTIEAEASIAGILYLRLMRPIPSLLAALVLSPAPTGVAVTLLPGCDRTIETCKTKFNNVGNCNAFPWFPGSCPFDGNSIA